MRGCPQDVKEKKVQDLAAEKQVLERKAERRAPFIQQIGGWGSRPCGLEATPLPKTN